MKVEHVITWGAKHPKTLFAIDASGAMLSALLLGVVLVELEYLFGIPRQTLYVLALFPCLFALYDFFCLVKKGIRIGVCMKGIALMNLLYCMLSIGLTLHHADVVTPFGWTYILLEVILVITLATVEYKVGRELTSKGVVT